MADPLLVSPKEFIAAVTGKWDIQGIPMVVSVWPTSEEELKDVLQKLSDSAALNSVPIGWVKKKEWVGLTEKETIDLALNAFALPEVSLEQRLHLHFELVKAMNEPDSRLMIFAATIEQALQEKNT